MLRADFEGNESESFPIVVQQLGGPAADAVGDELVDAGDDGVHPRWRRPASTPSDGTFVTGERWSAPGGPGIGALRR